ncbi:hypothetical protein HPB51_029027 [Rhipicephalus microplus]|uniref:Uncharacterized protein n=1 Tax=Rhipicephalus microplus TaxID=6941 RepID=A0A9J6CW45_RHIMP|nr:hypothetical protein HPB51_029027 [Rhipicephalus microplus]
MSQAKETTNATKSELRNQCICPEDTPTHAKTPKPKKRKRDDAADHKEGFITHLVPTTRRKLSALRCPPTPRCPAPNPKVPQRDQTNMLMSTGEQPAVALEPPLWKAAMTPHLTTASSQYLMVNGDLRHSQCPRWPTRLTETTAAGTRTTLSATAARLAATTRRPPTRWLHGDINVVPKDKYDDRKSKWRGKKCHNSTEDSSDSYRLKSRRNVFWGHEVLPTSGSPTVAPYKQPSLLQSEEATPTLVVKPLSPPLRSPPPEDNKHVTPYSLGGYPLGSHAQGAYDNAQDEDHTEEEEMHGGCNIVACIVLIVSVGLCVIITVLLALYAV